MNRMIRPSDCGDFLEHGLEPLLELAAELRPGDERAHVQGDELAVLQALGDVAGDDPLGQPLDDGRLAHARLADQHRVVLGPPASTWTTRRISESRPMTGSIFPFRASSTRSRP